MNWQKESINDLKAYAARKNSVLTMSEEIAELEAKAERLNSTLGKIPVQGGSSKVEDSLINNIVEKERLKTNLEITKKWILRVERGLSNLSEEEKQVLDGFYMANILTNRLEKLCDKLHCEKSTIYRIKEKALYKFTIAMYGIIDL